MSRLDSRLRARWRQKPVTTRRYDADGMGGGTEGRALGEAAGLVGNSPQLVPDTAPRASP